jgi:tetratricopeptide (TPR) repeat protein
MPPLRTTDETDPQQQRDGPLGAVDSSRTLAHGHDRGPDAWPRKGQLVGRYIVMDQLGAGAMGVIWRAHDPQLDRTIALKLVRGASGHARGPVARARLVREAQTLAKLSHANIVTVFDVGTEGDEVFVAMEWIDGRDLAAWLREPPNGRKPTWQRALALLLDAARGLQAAHDAGVVHRDFKPANVLVANDGRVAVGDFGLARADDDAAEPGDDGGRDLLSGPLASAGLTEAGTTVGTPAYMAPEQHYGAPANPRADQYAWAIATYEALYGARPFTSTSSDELAVCKRRGAPAPDHGSVPRRLWPPLQRALAANPADRWPSMDALATALRDAAGLSRRRLQRAGAALAVGLAAIAIARPWHDPPTPCDAVDAAADELWSDAAKEQVATAIADTRVAYAARAATFATEAIDQSIEQWRTARREACAATWVHGEQSAAALDLRMACLDRVLGRTAATISVLHGVDATRVERVSEIVAALPDPTACSSTTIADVPVATDEHDAAILRALDDASLRTLAADPTVGDALAQLSTNLLGSDRIGLRAQLELVRGEWLDQSGDATGATAALREATMLARSAGLARTEAEAWISLVRTSSRTRRVEQGRFYGEIAGAIVETLPAADDLAAENALQLGVLAFTVGDDDAAAQHYATALELYEHSGTQQRIGDVLARAAGVELRRGSSDRAAAMLERAIEIARLHYGEGHPRLATSLGNLGLVYAEQGRWDAALTTMNEAAAMLEAAWGPDHPAVAIAADSTGDVLRRAGRPAQARAYFERAIGIYERAFGDDHPAVSSALLGLGQALLDTGQTESARAPLERALRLAEPGRVSPVQRGDILFHSARALEASEPTRARSLAEDALDIYRVELRQHDDRLPDIEALLDRLPPVEQG